MKRNKGLAMGGSGKSQPVRVAVNRFNRSADEGRINMRQGQAMQAQDVVDGGGAARSDSPDAVRPGADRGWQPIGEVAFALAWRIAEQAEGAA